MSSTVDNRVVSMQFDNKQFESNAKTTMSTLDKLKNSLKFTDSAKGFENVTKAANGVNFSGMGSAIEGVKMKFSAMEVMAVTALMNITNSAVNAGKRLVNAFTFEPIMTGFQEYETQIDSVQTILANTSKHGTTLRQVNAALDELNLYADKTIYNFTQMTKNIGTFTAAGLKLDVATKSIQGIANLAATSGSTAQQASTAMYQLSQALSSGRVQLMDWNSVVNAGMGGKVFQDAIMETAEAMGGVSKELIEAYKNGESFRSLLEGNGAHSGDKGWFTSEILAETLQKFTKTGAVEYLAKYTDVSAEAIQKLQDLGEESGYDTEAFKEMAKAISNGNEETEKSIIATLKMANTSEDAATKVKTFSQLMDTLKEAAQSGWTETWELIIGDFGEAKELFTEISDTLGGILSDSANARNEMLSEGLKTGWKQFLDQGIMDEDVYTESVKKVAKEHGVAIEDMILKEGDFNKTLKNGWMTAEIAQESLQAMCEDINKLSKEELKARGYTDAHVKALNDLNTSIKDGSFDMDHFLEIMSRPSGRENLIEGLRNSFKAFSNVLGVVKEAFSEIFPATTGEQFYQFTVKIKEFTEKLVFTKEQLEPLKRTLKGVFAILHIGVTIISRIVSGLLSLLPVFTGFGGPVLEFTAGIGDALVSLDKMVSASGSIQDFFQRIRDGIAIVIEKLKQFKTDVMSDMSLPGLGKVVDLIDKMKEKFKELTAGTEEVGNTISRIFGGIYKAVVFAAKAIISVVDKLFSVFTSDANGLANVLNTLSAGGFLVFIINLTKGFKDVSKSGKGFLKTIGKILDNLSKTFKNTSEILKSVKGVLVAYQQEIKAKALKEIAIALAILAGSLWVLSSIDSEKLQSAIAAMSVMFVELGLMMKYLNGLSEINSIKDLFKRNNTKGLIAIAAAVFILASAMKKIGELDPTQMAASVAAIGALMFELSVMFNSIAQKEKIYIKGGKTMIAAAIAIRILASAVKALGELDVETLIKGVAGVGVLMFEISKFINSLDTKGKKLFSVGVSMILLGAAMKILASACKDFGSLDLETLAKGLAAMGVSLFMFSKFLNSVVTRKEKLVSLGLSMILLGAAMKVLASACKDFGSMDLISLAKGLGAIGLALLEVGLFMNNTNSKGFIKKAAGMVILGGALKILASVMKDIASLGLSGLGTALAGLGAGLLIISLALNSMNQKGIIKASAALLIASVALKIFGSTIQALGQMSLGQVAIALGALAGAIAVFGIAAKLLTPVIPAMLGLSAALVLLGAACFLVGAGLTLAGIGLGLFVGALAGGTAAIVDAIRSIAACIPDVVKYVGLAIIELCKVLIDGAPLIAKAIIVVIGETLVMIRTIIPDIVQTALELLIEIVNQLAESTPKLVTSLMQMLIGVINALADNIGELVQAAVNFLVKLFEGVLDAVASLTDEGIDRLSDAILYCGMMAGIMLALAGVASLAPGAMAGVLAMGAVLVELTAVLAAIGGLSKIPGLKELVDDGGNFLMSVGTAIGKLIGGIVGGIAEGVTSSLPNVADNLTSFAMKLLPFVTIASNIKPSMMDGVNSIIDMMLHLTGAELIEGVTSFLTGGSSLTKFGDELAAFGPKFKAYYDSISGMDPAVVSTSATAAKALAEMCDYIPNEGGITAWFTGDNTLSTFADELKKFGPSFMEYYNSISGMDPAVVTASANAAKALAEMCSYIPNEGGVTAWFAGDNTLSTFAEELKEFGPALNEYASSIGNIDPSVVEASVTAAKAIAGITNEIPNQGGVTAWFTGDNTLSTFAEELKLFGPALMDYAESIAGMDPNTVTASANAAKALAEMCDYIPNEGGVTAWFTGDNTLSTFAEELKEFGPSFMEYYNSVSGMDPEVVTASATAAKALAEMCSFIPNEGGIAAWFTGDNTLSTFADELKKFGPGFMEYYNSIAGMDPEVITASANAAKALAEMCSFIPNEGGVSAWFTGDNTLASFAEELKAFGPAIKEYAISVEGIDPDVINTSVNAAKAIAGITNELPNQGGIAAWFTGEKTLSGFAAELVAFGPAIKTYADSVAGIDISFVDASVSAAKAIAGITNELPNEGGIASWFMGEKSLSDFATELVAFGPAIKTYADSVVGIDTSFVEASVNAAKAIAGMAAEVPNEGGIVAWFTGDNTLSSFGTELEKFGPSMKAYADSVAGIDPAVVTASASAAQAIASMAAIVPNEGGLGSLFTGDNTLSSFGSNLSTFGTYLAEYSVAVADVNCEALAATTAAISGLLALATTASGTDFTGLSGFSLALSDMAAAGIDELIAKFDGSYERATTSINNFIQKCIDAVNAKKESIDTCIQSTFSSIETSIKTKNFMLERSMLTSIDKMVNAIKAKRGDFYNAGNWLVEGFAAGLDQNTYKATNAGRRMAEKVLQSAMLALDEHSPSKKGWQIGAFFSEGTANGISDLAYLASDASTEMAEGVVDGLSGTLNTLSSIISDEINADPVIKPVLDLSDVESGASRINSLFNRNQALRINGGLSEIANAKNQNGDKTSGNVTYEFTQNNYSPKALSRVDIYRQTRNQLSSLERLAKA